MVTTSHLPKKFSWKKSPAYGEYTKYTLELLHSGHVHPPRIFSVDYVVSSYDMEYSRRYVAQRLRELKTILRDTYNSYVAAGPAPL